MNNNEKKQMSILIVDDTEANIDMMLAILKEYDVIPSTSGADALSLLEDEPVDLILLDIIMPGMDGFQVCRQLKSNPDTQDIPVIFITAKDDEDSIEEAYTVGGVDYITKPFRPRELQARVRTHIGLQYTRKLLREKSEMQKELLHVLCHDLSNPLGAIESYSQFFLEFPDDIDFLVKNISVAARDGMKIIDFTRHLIAADEKEMETYPLNLKQIIEQSMSILMMKLQKKNIQIHLDIPDTLEVIAEEVSLSNTIFNNLMTNAIKFSEQGSVIKIYVETEKNNAVQIVIQDSGIGIPKNLLDILFDISKNINRIGTNGEEGTGFGMPLVKKFMKKYGGNIQVSSRSIEEFPADHGTKICLTFLTPL
ncbi:MAG: hybrid sensor histidine kinase/response regulator [Candidatus Magnetomorum sp.]|nr:hybrid sensor histidine kinase/response regulator [Candidatus Magnetomorum sp.]